MSVLLQQVAKDLRYVRRPLAAWLLLLLGETAARLLDLDLLLYPSEWSERVLRILSTLDPVTTVLGWFLAVRLVHADPVDGTTAFWLTRPISRRALWRSKLLLVGALFVLLPAATTGLVQASVAGAWTVLQGVAERVLLDAVFVLAAVWVAALTRDAARLVIAGVAGWVAWVFVQLRLRGAQGIAVVEPEAALVAASAVLVVGIAVSLGTLAAVRFVYVTRRRALALVTGGVLALAASFVLAAWPWNVFPSAWSPSESPIDADRITLTISGASPPTRRAPRDSRLVDASLRISGASDGWVVVPFHVVSKLHLGDGTVLRYDERTWEGRFVGHDFGPLARWASDGISDLVRARWAIVPGTAARGVGTAIAMPVPTGGRRAPLRGDLEATFTCSAFRGVVEAALPLSPGSARRAADTSVHVLRAGTAPRESWADIFVVNTRAVTPQLLLPRRERSLSYVLLNRQRSEWLSERALGSSIPGASGWFAPTWVRYDTRQFLRQAAADRTDDEWLRDAELVILSFEEMGTFTKTVRIPDFEIPPARGDR